MRPSNEVLRMRAKRNGCTPVWSDGLLGYAWHCTCAGNTHGCDSQCSAITVKSAQRSTQ